MRCPNFSKPHLHVKFQNTKKEFPKNWCIMQQGHQAQDPDQWNSTVHHRLCEATKMVWCIHGPTMAFINITGHHFPFALIFLWKVKKGAFPYIFIFLTTKIVLVCGQVDHVQEKRRVIVMCYVLWTLDHAPNSMSQEQGPKQSPLTTVLICWSEKTQRWWLMWRRTASWEVAESDERSLRADPR